MKKYKHKSHLPPALFTSALDGKKYIVPTWIEVEQDTTLDDVEWEQITYTKNQSNGTNYPTGSI
jgi:hypothetical protein